MNGIKMLCRKYKDIILYGIFGVTTTLVNVAVYWFVAHPIGLSTLPSTIIAWIMAVFFAYITNRKWVFHSEAHTRDEIMKEVVSFFSCRIATGAVDW
ncbi:MAG TPA: teichoic acid glycosylation protein, partial [Lactococcus sp.]|nr:teichoic acid glycosylation protein [Lactococcus sp.]